MKIIRKNASMVKPMKTKANTTLWLSNLDAAMAGNYHIRTLYFYRSTGAADFFNCGVLKAALSRALVDFYPVAGRLTKGNNRTGVDCNGEGALFMEAEADGAMNELGDLTPRAELGLIPVVDYSKGISTYPILMLQIKVKESTMVKPMTGKATTTLWISNLDATIPSMHILLLYFYRSTDTAANFFNPAVLKAALSRTLVEFYPVAGRLKKDDNDRIEIECNGDGALLVEAEADGKMDFAPRPELRLIPEVAYSQGISAYPLLLLQVTRFKCGGVCLGLAMEHHVTDGFSAFHFIREWSRIARGLDIAVPPFVDRRVLSARNPPEPKFTHAEYHPPPVLKRPEGNSVNSETIFSTFKLSRDQINAFKSRCQVDEGETVPYSTYEVLAGHIWRCVCKARGLPKDQETKLYIPVDGRSRLRPHLPPGYFGNVVFTAAPIALCGDLESNPLRFAVGKIHEALARMDDEYLRSALDYIESKVDLKSHASGGSPFKCPNIGIISWVRFPVYDADFGWGKPLYMGLGSPPSEGKINLLPSPIDDGSLVCAISLPEEQMQIFEKLLYQI